MYKINKAKFVRRAYAESRYSGSLEITYSNGKISVKKMDRSGKANFRRILSTFSAVMYAIPTKVLKKIDELQVKLLPSNGFIISGKTPDYSFTIDSLVKKDLTTLPPEPVTIPDDFAYFCKLFGLYAHGEFLTNGVIKIKFEFPN